MIYYTLKVNECLGVLIKAFSRNGNRYWMHGSIPIHKVNDVLPKLYKKYSLNENTNGRKVALRSGDPVWSLVCYYDPKNIGIIQFWLITTGYRKTDRSTSKDEEQLSQLNKKLCVKENLKDIYTTNSADLLRFKEFVFGQYIDYLDMNSAFSKTYLYPEKYGVPIKQDVFKNQTEVLSIKSITNQDHVIDIEINNTEKLKEKHLDLRRDFGFVFYTEDYKNQTNKLTHREVLNRLKYIYGIKLPEDVEYNSALNLLAKKNIKTNNRYLSIFQAESRKVVVFTWYLSNDFINNISRELVTKLKRVQRRPKDFEDVFKRLYARGNYNGVRHQIGRISASTKAYAKKLYPILYEHIHFPETLHYVRFSNKSFSNFREFQDACVIETILSQKRSEQKDQHNKRLKLIRTTIRNSKPEYNQLSVNALNRIIRSFNKEDPSKLEVTAQDLIDFLDLHGEMNPDLIADTF